jgi:hypothetical protein
MLWNVLLLLTSDGTVGFTPFHLDSLLLFAPTKKCLTAIPVKLQIIIIKLLKRVRASVKYVWWTFNKGTQSVLEHHMMSCTHVFGWHSSLRISKKIFEKWNWFSIHKLSAEKKRSCLSVCQQFFKLSTKCFLDFVGKKTFDCFFLFFYEC